MVLPGWSQTLQTYGMLQALRLILQVRPRVQTRAFSLAVT